MSTCPLQLLPVVLAEAFVRYVLKRWMQLHPPFFMQN